MSTAANQRQLNALLLPLLAIALPKVLGQNVVIANLASNETDFFIEFKSATTFSSKQLEKLQQTVLKLAKKQLVWTVCRDGSGLNSYLKTVYETTKNECQVFYNQANDCYIISAIALDGMGFDQIQAVHFKAVSNSYWLGDENNEAVQRISGVAFASEDEKTTYLTVEKEKEASDHRRIGAQQQIFTFEENIGKGLPIWLPNGEKIKKKIKHFLWQTFDDPLFQFVDTPVLGNKKLYIQSGHWEHYQENNFPPLQIENEVFMLRPMTCPHHITIYNQTNHSYRELPIAYCEDSKLFRYETSGGLLGLERVRAMELFDCHVIVRQDQIADVIHKLETILQKIHQKFHLQIHQVDLSLRDVADQTKYHGDDAMWLQAENQLRTILQTFSYPVKEMLGEAAFYGPKIDYQVQNNLGKLITISTIQLDFLLPTRFNMHYVDDQNNLQTPVLIHFGPIGTYERFIATLLSQNKGVLPFWLAPTQVMIIPIHHDLHQSYAKSIAKMLKIKGVSYQIDLSNERFNKKLRNAQTHKIPYQIIVGDQEVANKTVALRAYGENTTTSNLTMVQVMQMFSEKNQ